MHSILRVLTPALMQKQHAWGIYMYVLYRALVLYLVCYAVLPPVMVPRNPKAFPSVYKSYSPIDDTHSESPNSSEPVSGDTLTFVKSSQ